MESAIAIGAAILGNEQVFNLVSTTAIGFLCYLAQKVSSRYVRQEEIARSQDALLAAAHEMYPMVAAFKDSTSDKHLTEAQRAILRERAMARATEIAKSTGIDLAKVLGPSVAQAMLEQGVKSLKSRAPQVLLPPDVAARLMTMQPAPTFTIPVVGGTHEVPL